MREGWNRLRLTSNSNPVGQGDQLLTDLAGVNVSIPPVDLVD
jgi:hypothetical protein